MSNKIQATINGVQFVVETSERIVEVNGVVFKFGNNETLKIVKVSGFVYHNKIQAIKAIREASGMNLKDAKDTFEIISQYRTYPQANQFYLECSNYEAAKDFMNRMNGLGFNAEFV